MIQDYDDSSTQLSIETPSGLPENVRHALNVLSRLGVKDDAMFMALVNDCISADPLHLCRMVQQGLFSGLPEIQQPVFSGTELHIPFGPGELPPREVLISLRDNAVIATYFNTEEDQYKYIASRPIFAHQIISYLDSVGGDDGDARAEALVDLIRHLQKLAQVCYVGQSGIDNPDRLFAETVALIDVGGEGC